MRIKKCVAVFVLLCLSTHRAWGIWPFDDDDEDSPVVSSDTERTSATEPLDDAEDEIGSGDIILIDGATDTAPTPPTTTTTTTSTTTSQPPPATTTPTPWRPSKPKPKPKPTPARKEDTSTPPKPLVKTGRPHRPLGKVARTVVVKQPPGRTAGAEALRDVRLRDQYLPAYSLVPVAHRGNLHEDAAALQSYISTCDNCMVGTNPVTVCPLHQVSVDMHTWLNQLHSLLSQGCPMGTCDRARCCVNADATLLNTLRDMTHRIRDVYHVLQNSCTKCPRDGEWTEWSVWSQCPVTCGSGTRTRTRTCTNPPPRNGGRQCQGPGRETSYCFPAAPVNGAWTQWEAWSGCSVTCGQGTRSRIRTCRNPPPNACGQPCPGRDLETDSCRREECCVPSHGNWTPWSSWSQCSASCGLGIRDRSRTCNSPQPNDCGRPCVGYDRQQDLCQGDDCCQDGVWGQWAPWSECSVTCGEGGVHRRSRQCDSPAPNRCGKACDGPATESTSCNCEPCCVDGNWGSWLPWGTCSVTCGTGGVRTRLRRCDNPAPDICGRRCFGEDSQSERCGDRECCVDGNWGSWLPWSACSVTCGPGGERNRIRRCDNPQPNFCGRQCFGEGSQREQCGDRECCVDGNWGQWGSWSACPVTCGVAERVRIRQCDFPAPNYCGRSCVGPSSETSTQRCGPDPGEGVWSQWSPWSLCSVTCGPGYSRRTRTCSSSRDNPCARPCPGPNVDTRSCGTGSCCEWTTWSMWSSCLVTCGDGLSTRTRTRTCVYPDQRQCPRGCEGSDRETGTCRVPPCVPPAIWGEWEPWCPCNCRKGVTERRRSCLRAGVDVDRVLCAGLAKEERPCDVRDEPSCPECITSCSGRADGDHPACNGCSYYINCRNNLGTLKRCTPSDFQWDSHRFSCVYPPSESCSLRPPVMACRYGADGYFHAVGSCRRYVECRGGVETERSCPGSQEFNAHRQACDLPPSPTCIRQLSGRLVYQLDRLQGDAPHQNTESDGTADNKNTTTDAPKKQTHSNSGNRKTVTDGDKTADAKRNGKRDSETRPMSTDDGMETRTEESHMQNGSSCYANCQGLKRGMKYQSCQGCRFYLSCPRNGPDFIFRCLGRQVWDDVLKKCQRRSSTCKKGRHSHGSKKGRHSGSNDSLVSSPSIDGIKVHGV